MTNSEIVISIVFIADSNHYGSSQLTKEGNSGTTKNSLQGHQFEMIKKQLIAQNCRTLDSSSVPDENFQQVAFKAQKLPGIMSNQEAYSATFPTMSSV